eukprot:CAMPEP_0175285122 /NCGR_PEP_ID=MMETSP0093-20121207/53071_1 /TAXON_ID=311494 /ORGANISM="Alexandrium monilatum, Strain CCMP3105" /LENGTH=55 /DNA_ID=CAMNT_0016580519 /DNA_START=68 /DNA_END=232 /DNA_ORIENTATION=+
MRTAFVPVTGNPASASTRFSSETFMPFASTAVGKLPGPDSSSSSSVVSSSSSSSS